MGTWGLEKVEPICLNRGFWDRRFKDVNLLLQCLGYPSNCIILGRTLLHNLKDCKQYLSTIAPQGAPSLVDVWTTDIMRLVSMAPKR